MKITASSRKLFFTFLLLIIIALIRFFLNYPLLVGGESYYTIRISEEIGKDAIIQQDPLGENYSFSILHYFLAFINYKIKILLPLILGLLTGFFYYKIMDKKHSVLSTALLFVSPLFLSTFMQLSNVMFAIFLSVFSAYLISNRRMISFTFIQGILILAHFEIWLFLSIFFLYKYRPYIALIPGVLLIPLTFNINFVFSRIFFEFGANQGYSLFIVLLGIIGFFWRKKNPLRAIMIFIGFVLSIFIPDIRLLGVLIIIPYAASAIIKLISRKWELEHIKQATIFLIFLVLAFSAVGKASELIHEAPNDLEIYNKLKEMPDGTVLANEQEGHFIQYFSEKKVFVDERSSLEKKNYANNLLNSQDHNYVIEELKNKQITYILVPRSEERGGFLFIADNSANLTLIHAETLELWFFSG